MQSVIRTTPRYRGTYTWCQTSAGLTKEHHALQGFISDAPSSSFEMCFTHGPSPSSGWVQRGAESACGRSLTLRVPLNRLKGLSELLKKPPTPVCGVCVICAQHHIYAHNMASSPSVDGWIRATRAWGQNCPRHCSIAPLFPTQTRRQRMLNDLNLMC